MGVLQNRIRNKQKYAVTCSCASSFFVLPHNGMQSAVGSPISPPSPPLSDSSADDSVSSASERVPKQEIIDSTQIHVDTILRGPPPTTSRQVSPSTPSSGDGPQQEVMNPGYDDTATCMWDDCGMVFTHLPTLIEHIHSGMHWLISASFFFLRVPRCSYVKVGRIGLFWCHVMDLIWFDKADRTRYSSYRVAKAKLHM